MSRLTSRIEALKNRRGGTEPYPTLKLLTTEELARALLLVEQGGVLPDGEVHNPEVYRQASQEALEAVERWAELCGEPLDYLDAAEELLDRMGDAYGWRSQEAFAAARLREIVYVAVGRLGTLDAAGGPVESVDDVEGVGT